MSDQKQSFADLKKQLPQIGLLGKAEFLAEGIQTDNSIHTATTVNGIVVSVGDVPEVVDNHKILEILEGAALPVELITVKDHGNLEFEILVTIPEQKGRVITKGDKILNAIQIVNRVNGKSHIKAIISRLVCSNGLRVTDSEIYPLSADNLPDLPKLMETATNESGIKLSKAFNDLIEFPLSGQKFMRFLEKELHPAFIEEGFPKRAENPHGIMLDEANQLDVEVNLWLAYNSYNQSLYNHQSSMNLARKEALENKILERTREIIQDQELVASYN